MERKIEYVIDSVFNEKNSKKYVKKLKLRLRKRLRKDLLDHSEIPFDEDQQFLDDLITSLRTKFEKCDPSDDAFESANPEQLVETATQPIATAESSIGEAEEVTGYSSTAIAHRNYSDRYHQIYLVREIKCLKEIVKMLKVKVAKKDGIILKERERRSEVLTKNNLLSYRSKELTRLKMKPYVSARTILLVDTAVYSDFFGYIDNQILETSVSVVNIDHFKPTKRNLFQRGNFRDVYQYTLDNGEMVVLKKVRDDLGFSDEKCVSVLSVEARIAKILQHQVNIVDYHGLLVKDATCFIVQSMEPPCLLKEYFMRNKNLDPLTFCSILRGVGAAITHVHSKGFLINNVRHDNIALHCYSSHYRPVLLSLSLACREGSSKNLTTTQQSRFDNCLHLPPRVLRGLVPPSYASDRYGAAFIIGNVIHRLKSLGIVVPNSLSSLHRDCYNMGTMTIEEFDHSIYDCCDDLEE